MGPLNPNVSYFSIHILTELVIAPIQSNPTRSVIEGRVKSLYYATPPPAFSFLHYSLSHHKSS